jgi:hypothetical protein
MQREQRRMLSKPRRMLSRTRKVQWKCPNAPILPPGASATVSFAERRKVTTLGLLVDAMTLREWLPLLLLTRRLRRCWRNGKQSWRNGKQSWLSEFRSWRWKPRPRLK